MKKSNLINGIVYALAGAACFGAALITESKLDGLLWGFAGAGMLPGLVMIFKYFYWSSPENKQRYQDRLDNEKIEMHDELNEKLRDRSGRYTYILGLLVLSISMVVFSVLGSLKIFSGAREIVLFSGGFLLFQIVSGILIFNCLRRKY